MLSSVPAWVGRLATRLATTITEKSTFCYWLFLSVEMKFVTNCVVIWHMQHLSRLYQSRREGSVCCASHWRFFFFPLRCFFFFLFNGRRGSCIKCKKCWTLWIYCQLVVVTEPPHSARCQKRPSDFLVRVHETTSLSWWRFCGRAHLPFHQIYQGSRELRELHFFFGLFMFVSYQEWLWYFSLWWLVKTIFIFNVPFSPKVNWSHDHGDA